MKKIITKPIIGIVILIIGIGLLCAKQFIPGKYGNAVGEIEFNEPTILAVADDGRYAVIDNMDCIYVMNDKCEYQFAIEAKDDELIQDVDFDENGNLYVVFAGTDDEGVFGDTYINKYDNSGKFIREVHRISDENVYAAMAFDVSEDIITYIVSEEESDYIVEYNMQKDKKSYTDIPRYDDGNYVWKATTDHNGNYALTYLDRTVGILYADGEYEEMLYCYYDIFGNPDDVIVAMANIYDDGIVYKGNDEYYYKIMYSDDPTQSSDLLLDVSELVDKAEFEKEELEEGSDIEDYLYISGMNSLEDGLAFSAHSKVYILDEDENITVIDSCKKIPFIITIDGILHRYGLITGLIFFAIGMVLCIGNAMKWHMNLLWKQLFFTVPIVIVMFVFITAGFVNKYTELFVKDSAQSLLQINYSAMKDIDVVELEDMTNYESVWDGRILNVSELLYNNLNNGVVNWDENIVTNVYLFDYDLHGILIADSYITLEPFLATLDLGVNQEELYEFAATDKENYLLTTEDSVVLLSGSYGRNEYVTAATFLYDEDFDEPVAMITSELDYSKFIEAKNKMIQEIVVKALAFLLLLIAAIFVSTYLSTKKLKKAGEAITEIAAGNFEARIENCGKDEVGAICGGVNEMAKQLEVHFEELDRNEKFYYKFVPEKFKELLHKDSFTDLQLGDAESADLTVLFCDIRSFSLNSEMMTAKENFEFVNVIYGKAGPIIRRHGGFVDKYIGDAVMALFENADDAVAAGRDLYKEIVLDKSTAEELGITSINIGIGIHSGMARIGIVGEEERLSGTVISNTVNISSRLESLTKQYNTAMIITKETLDRLSDPDGLSTRYLGMIQVAGVNEVKALYEVLDCLDDERRIPREKISFDFREAIKAYHLGKANESEELLAKLLGTKNDPVPEMYYEYVKEKIATGDMEHNVFKFEKK